TGLFLSSFACLSFYEGLQLLMRERGPVHEFYGLGVPLRQMIRFIILFELGGDNVVYYSTGLIPVVLITLAVLVKPWKAVPRFLAGTLLTLAIFFLIH